MSLDSPHDALFKEIFSDPRNAAVELRAVLPPEITAAVDWNSLRIEPGSFVEVADASRFADLLFSAEIAGARSFLYLLFEHQSSPDRFMPLRLLGYMLRKWEQCLRQEPRPLHLPPIVPVVLHHSAGGWNSPLSLHELFDTGLLQNLHLTELTPSFRFVLDDLSLKTDAELLERATRESERLVPVVLWALRDARAHERFLASLSAWAGAIAEAHQAPSGADALRAVFSYIARVTELLSPHAILTAIEQVAPQTKDIVMTLAEQWLQQGIQKGIEKGIEKGERALLVKLLTLKFGALDDSYRTRLDSAPPALLEIWAERVLTATTIYDVFT